MFKNKFLLVLLLIAAALRLWQLGNVPISPDWDEVALGYNAYSILETGRDEYGKFLPIVLRSFDDYKPALYAYFVIPAIKVFGLSVFAVRLPSAVFGILTVAATYFLLTELFKKSKLHVAFGLKSHAFTLGIPEIGSLLLAISPWHLQFSRTAFEANVGLSFNIFATLFFLKGLRRPMFLFLSAACFGINLYVYQSEKVFSPLLLFGLIFIFRKQLFVIPKKYINGAAFFGLLIIIPMILFSFASSDVFSRAKGVSIFSKDAELLKITQQRINDFNKNDVFGIIFNNRRVVYAKKIIENYLAHYSITWLFITGDTNLNRHHAPSMGLLYLASLPFIFIGIYQLIFYREEHGFDKKVVFLVFLWFLIAPIPASITFEVPHAVRTLNFLPTFQIFSAVGLLWFLQEVLRINYKFFRVRLQPIIFCAVAIIFLFNIIYFLNQYFVQQNYFYAFDWQYGYESVVSYIKPIAYKYKKIIVSDQHDMAQSYMFFLFYLNYDPKKYLSEGGSKNGKIGTHDTFSNFEFRPFNYYQEEHNVLLVSSEYEFPELFKVVHTVNYPNKKIAIKVVQKD